MLGEKDYFFFVGFLLFICEIEIEWYLFMGIYFKWLVGIKVIIIN